MPYPTAKVHRVNRRKLGRGQYPSAGVVAVTLTNPSADVVLLTFSMPVVVTGTIPTTTTSGTFVSQTVTSATTVAQTFSASQAAATVSVPAAAANVATYQGGRVAGTSVTF
jgi:hypothetical protein